MYLSDMHTHSIASGHGTECTITNMARAAAEKGLRLLGITDHGPGTLAAGTSSYFRSLTYSPKKHFGVELLYGIELNILDRSGTVDLDQELLCKLDYAIASMHAWNYRCGTRAENTEAFINVMKNPCVKILGHSDNTHYPVNYDALARVARETGTIFEINEASLAPYGYRGDTRENCFEILRCCRKYDLPLLLSSDSHGPEHIGDFTCAAEFVHQAMFPEQLGKVDLDQFVEAVNKVEPGLIRTEADELTYSLHIMVRYELEKALMQGTLAVADLPAAWNAKYKEYLGVDVPDDAHGCLQDIHWSMGDIGYFPSYALGSAYGAQALDDLRKTNDFDAQWANGDVEPLKAALKERVWQWGSMKEPAWLVESLCGGKFDPHHFTDYLKKKYTELYEL